MSERRRVFMERLAMYRWKPQEVLLPPDSEEAVALLFSSPAPPAEVFDWLAWYATEKARAIRDQSAPPPQEPGKTA